MSAQSEALRLADSISRIDTLTDHQRRELLHAAAELRRLSSVEAELLAMRRVFSEAGCTFDVNYIRRLVRAEAQRDALLEALRELLTDAEFLGWGTAKARAAIKQAEGETR